MAAGRVLIEPIDDCTRVEPALPFGFARPTDVTDAPAPANLEGHADATWGDRNLYGLILTYAGAAIYHSTKKIALIVDSSMETEAIASAKGAETISYAREVFRAFGVGPSSPTLIGTDNLANPEGQPEGGHRRGLPNALEALSSALRRAQTAHPGRRGHPQARPGHPDAGGLPHEVDSGGKARAVTPLCVQRA